MHIWDHVYYIALSYLPWLCLIQIQSMCFIFFLPCRLTAPCGLVWLLLPNVLLLVLDFVTCYASSVLVLWDPSDSIGNYVWECGASPIRGFLLVPLYHVNFLEVHLLPLAGWDNFQPWGLVPVSSLCVQALLRHTVEYE